MTQTISGTVDIIGAGIAGLAAARALSLRGAQVRVFERSAEIAEVGAGIQISPNGTRVLAALGLFDALAARSRSSASVTLNDHRARRVARLSLQGLGPFLLCHRADVIDVLLRGAQDAGAQIHLDHEFVDLDLRCGVSDITFRQRKLQRAGIVIGADGGKSAIRRFLDGRSAPPFSGQVAWRALVPLAPGEAATLPDGAQVFMGPGRHVVAYPLRDGSVLNIVAVEERADWAEEGWRHRGDPDRLRAAFSAFADPIPDWLARVEEVMVWGLFRHPVATRWQGDGLALIGDAAHPTLPFLAQGACLALEDAWVLADSLSQAQTLPEGLVAYEARRHDRAEAVVNAATANAFNYHLRGPLRLIGHGLLRGVDRLAPARLVRRYDWLYGHDVTQGAAGF